MDSDVTALSSKEISACCEPALHHSPILTHMPAQDHVEPWRQIVGCCLARHLQIILHCFNVAPDNGPEKKYYDNVIDLMHRVAHEHLADTETYCQPERILHKMLASHLANTVLGPNTLASLATAVCIPFHYLFALGMGPCSCLQHSLFRLPSGFLARIPFGLQKILTNHVATMTGCSLARNLISFLLVPHETLLALNLRLPGVTLRGV
jgi:hypothetical protein